MSWIYDKALGGDGAPASPSCTQRKRASDVPEADKRIYADAQAVKRSRTRSIPSVPRYIAGRRILAGGDA